MSTGRVSYSLISEPSGDVYRRLLLGLSRLGETIGVVVRPGVGLSAEGQSALASLSDLAISQADASEWPGTRLLRGSARVIRLPASARVAKLMGTLAESLYAWQQPNLPEDLFFLRGDGSTLLGSIAHEADAFLELSREEEDSLAEIVPELSEIARLEP